MPVSAVLADNEVSKYQRQHTSSFACLGLYCVALRVCGGRMRVRGPLPPLAGALRRAQLEHAAAPGPACLLAWADDLALLYIMHMHTAHPAHF